MIRTLLTTLLLLTSLPAWTQFSAMFWNVENFFDTRHDSLKLDEEFLPESVRNWNSKKFRKKLSQTAQVIAAAQGWDPPVLVGLCEVENNYVMNSLVTYGPLGPLGYRYVMTDSEDPRGIDVALIYRRDRFKLLHWQAIQAGTEEKKTRDILHVCGKLLHGDTLDVFVAHFPSRRGGVRASAKYRTRAATQLKNATDSLCRVRENPNILIMGDFNDEPDSHTVKEVLYALPPEGNPCRDSLYHLLARKAGSEETGTYKYQGKWSVIDHLIVSGNLLDKQSGFYTSEAQASILRLPFLLTKDEKFGGTKPFRTYLGPRYIGGYSDHLPVMLEFTEEAFE